MPATATPRLAANLSLLFTELPFLERFAAAANGGFRAVEFLFPYEHEPRVLAELLRDCGLDLVLFNLPPGDWERGERGIAALPGREVEFRRSVETGLSYARALGSPRLHAMAGIVPPQADRSQCEAVFLANLVYAAAQAASAGVTLLLEPLNPVDFPGYFLNSVAQAERLRAQLGRDNVKIQFDVYHQQMSRGAVVDTLREHFAQIAHIQIAGVPGRHEPDATQELNFEFFFSVLDELGYDGWIGCEYRPREGTAAGLGWARRYGIGSDSSIPG